MQPISAVCFVALWLTAAITSGSAFPQDLKMADDVRSYANSLFGELPEESYQATVENYRLKRSYCDYLFGKRNTKKCNNGFDCGSYYYCSQDKVCECIIIG